MQFPWLLALAAFFGGVLTIVSPCTLPVLPFVFARSDRPFARSTLPLLLGMALAFAAIATLAAVGGAWAVRLNVAGRWAALLLLALVGVALLSESFAALLARPAVALGNRLAVNAGATAADVGQSALLGVATGLLWAPCAGPILGLILTAAALGGPSTRTSLLLLAYALGAALSMAAATLLGRGVLALMRHSLAVTTGLRRGLGVLVLAAVVTIAMGWDTGVLTRVSIGNTSRLEQGLLAALHAQPAESGRMSAAARAGGGAAPSGRGASSGADAPNGQQSPLPNEGAMPPLDGAVAWINSTPLTRQSLRGRVVLVDFWTYSCINCLRTLPYLESWYQRYRNYGLVIVGVHSPEFAFERNLANVRRAVRDLGIDYPVAVDSHLAIWQAFNNQYWPADYFVDSMGNIEGHQFGEGDYIQSEQLLRALLEEAGAPTLPPPVSARVRGRGIQAAPDLRDIESPETYLGYARASGFVSAEALRPDAVQRYLIPLDLPLNRWALGGSWTVGAQYATLQRAPGRIVFRFHARDLHVVLGPGADGRPIRFRVSIDGHAPRGDHGVDTDASGAGVVRDQRLYQLIRQSGAVRDRTFAIEFLDPGVQAYSFTFG